MMIKRFALIGLGTVLGVVLGAVGVLTGQRSNVPSASSIPNGQWRTVPTAGHDAHFPTAVASTTDVADDAQIEADLGVTPPLAVDDANSEPAHAATRGQGPVRYLTVGEVAELLSTTTAALSKTADLPEPDAVVGRTRGWLESTINRVVDERTQR